MGLLEIVGLAVALGADAFSVCVGLGMDRVALRRAGPFAMALGLVQSALVMAGHWTAVLIHWLFHHEAVLAGLAGRLVGSVPPERLHEQIHAALSVLGALVLAWLGINLIAPHLRRGGRPVPARTGGLVALAVAVNADALSAGLALGMIDAAALPAVALTMLGVGSLLSLAGLWAGRRIGRGVGRAAQPVGGMILVIIALRGLAAAF